jgi:hypothetical protein
MVDKAAIPSLTEMLKIKDANVRGTVRRTLQRMGPDAKAAIPMLKELFKEEKDANVRLDVAAVLGHLGPEGRIASIPAFAELANEKDLNVKNMAILTLMQIGPEAKAAFPILMELLREKESFVRLNAARALGQMGPEGKTAAISALSELLKKDDAYTAMKGVICPREIRGVAPARHEGVTRGVYRNTGAEIIAAASTEVGCPGERTGSRDLRYKGVRNPMIGVIRPREIRGKGSAGHEGVARGIHGNTTTQFVTASAEVGCPGEVRVDDQLVGGVEVAGDCEPVGFGVKQVELPGHRHLPAADGLIDERRIVT